MAVDGSGRHHATRLLIVDDDDLVRGMLQAVLEDAGYACATATCVAEAVAVLDELPIELALVDVMLPDGSGIDVVAQLHARFPGTAALVVTGLSDQGTARQAIGHGAHGMLVKPFTPDELIVAVAAARTRRDLDVEAREREDRLAGKLASAEVELKSASSAIADAMTRIDSAGHELLARLAGALEARDLVTGEHIRRVSEGTRLLARALGLPADQAELIGEASTMHDIGKIGLEDSILRKPGKLSDEEWSSVREHPVIGRRILENSDLPVMRVAAQIAAHHHERWDGTGYPDGLAGEQIPLAARIVSVVDTFDALTTARPYRGPLPVEEALAILREGSGSQFDPTVVDAFFAIGDAMLMGLGVSGRREPEEPRA